MAAMTGPQKPSMLWVLQGSFLLATVMYVGVGMVMTGRIGADASGRPPAAADSPLGMILVGAGVLVAALATLVPRMIPALDPEAQAGASDYLATCARRLVVTNAFFEVPAVLGLTGTLLGLPLTPFLILVGVSFAGLATMVPRIAGWIAGYESRKAREPLRGDNQ